MKVCSQDRIFQIEKNKKVGLLCTMFSLCSKTVSSLYKNNMRFYEGGMMPLLFVFFRTSYHERYEIVNFAFF